MLRIFPDHTATMSLISGLRYVNLLARYRPPTISPSMCRAHMPQMDAGREVGLILSGLIQASRDSLDVMSRLSGWSATRTNPALHTAEIAVASHRGAEIE